MTIVTKIAMQINVKMDGGLWHVQVPVRNKLFIQFLLELYIICPRKYFIFDPFLLPRCVRS